MLYINPIGGLANRMRALASGISLASKLNVDFSVIWLKNWELNAGFNDIFCMSEDLFGKLDYPSKARYGMMFSIPRLKNCYLSKLFLKRFGTYCCGEQPFWQKIISNDNSGRELEKYFINGFSDKRMCLIQGGTEMYPFSDDLYRHLFRPNCQITEQVDERLRLLGDVSYGVHIRRTDNSQSILNSPDEAFITAINEIQSTMPDARFYLATDSDDVKKKFKRIYGDSIICSEKTADRNSVEGIQEAAIEMFTLSNTQLIIGSFYSSFSEAAAKIGNVPLRQVVAPR